MCCVYVGFFASIIVIVIFYRNVRVSVRLRPFIMQDFFRLKNALLFPVLFVTSFLNFLVRV